MKQRFFAGNQGTNSVSNGVGPTGSPYGGASDHDDRQWNPPVANEDVPETTKEKLDKKGDESATDARALHSLPAPPEPRLVP